MLAAAVGYYFMTWNSQVVLLMTLEVFQVSLPLSTYGKNLWDAQYRKQTIFELLSEYIGECSFRLEGEA